MTGSAVSRTIPTMPARRLPRQAKVTCGWLATPQGRALAEHAQRCWVEPPPAGAAGQFLLRMKPLADWAHEEPATRFAHAVDLHVDAGRLDGDWRCAGERLPLPSQSLARIELRFILEALDSPEALLAECARTLCPEGRLWVAGLNPFGFARLRWRRHGLRALSASKVAAVLENEGLTVLHRQALGAHWQLPRSAVGAPAESGFEPGRVAWGLLATRRDQGVTPLRRVAPAWRALPGVPAR